MTAGFGIFLIALGAIIRYAINFEVAGIEEDTIGLILMIAGAAVLVLSLVQMAFMDRDRRVVDERRDPRYPPR
jgi:Domain of unknown function (DUF6458)